MADRIRSFYDLLKLWPSPRELASDMDVKEVTARAWRQRGIPSEYWLGIIASAKKHGIKGVTLELLATLSAAQAGKVAA